MDLGPHTVQIFVSLIVVLAVAGVALVCDLLKGNNEHLRELAVELKVRNEEAERRAVLLEKRSKRVPDLSGVKPMIAATPQAAVGAAAPVPMQSKPQVAAAARSQQPAFSQQPSITISKPAAAAAVASSEPSVRRERRRREMSPAVAAVAQAAAAIANRERPQTAVALAENETESVMAAAPAAAGRKDWNRLLAKTNIGGASIIPFETIREVLPAGMHDAVMLQRAIEAAKPVTGLVISIGTNSLNAVRTAEVSNFLRSLLGPNDFACQTGSEEFVVVCPGDQGAGSAQRRLSELAEKLWDFQLRSLGEFHVQFSWGSVEAKGERIGEAVAGAIEQMQETRRVRCGKMAKAV